MVLSRVRGSFVQCAIARIETTAAVNETWPHKERFCRYSVPVNILKTIVDRRSSGKFALIGKRSADSAALL
jgi:hypothetical protein